MSHLIDTGDNPTHREKILKKVVKTLEQKHNCETLLAVPDTTKRRHAYKLRQRDTNVVFYLVARSTPPYHDFIVSIQKSLVERAWREGHSILMFVDGEMLAFVPAHILSFNFGTNKRYDVSMLNFDVKLGSKWNGKELVGWLSKKESN